MNRIAIDCFHFVGMRNGSGGSGSYILSLIEHLAHEIDVDVIVSPRNIDQFHDLDERLRRLRLRLIGDDHAAALREAAFDVDLLYAPFTSLPDRESYAATPVVTAIHDLQHRMEKSFFPIAERLDRDRHYFAAASAADGILTFSSQERDNIQRFYHPTVPIGVLPHAPFLYHEILRDAGRTDLERSRNPCVEKYGRFIFYPAVNWPHKNHYRLIEAFQILCEELAVRDVKLVLAGASCVEDRTHFYEQLLESPRARDRIVHLGFVSNVKLFLLMTGAELMVFPSVYEGFGIPVVEAMRFGTPVLATDLPVFEEWFGDSIARFRSARDSAAMAADMAALLGDTSRRQRLRDAGIDRASQYSPKRMATETLEFLTSVADRAEHGQGVRARPTREIRSLVARTYKLVTYVLFEAGTRDDLERVLAALAVLRSRHAPGEAGFVVILPYGFLDKDGRFGSDVAFGDVERIYYDPDQPEHRGEAIRFYAATQVDAAFYRFARAADVSRLVETAAGLGRLALYESEGVAGYFLGSRPWDNVRQELRQLASMEPVRFTQALKGGEAIGISDFALARAYVCQHDSDCFGSAVLSDLVLCVDVKAPRPRFAYLEPELKQAIGHHLGLVRGICRAAFEYGYEPLVGANRSYAAPAAVGSELKFDPCFSSYAIAPEAHVTPSNFCAELAEFITRQQLGPDDLIYLHMPYPTLMAGIVQYVISNHVDDLPIFVIRICSDNESMRWHDIRMTNVARTISELGRRRDKIRLFVESVALQTYFEELSGVEVPVLLNPITPDLVFAGELAREFRIQRAAQAPVTFGYFGEARGEKGFVLLPAIVETLLQRFGPDRVRFSLQVSMAENNAKPPALAAKAKLEELRSRYQGSGKLKTIELHETAFSTMAQYYSALAKCDAMLMPYEPVAYAVRGSGVALEALAVGQPIIVTAGTDMATTFAGKACLVAADHSAAAFVAVCSDFMERRAAIVEDVAAYVAASPMFMHEHQFVRALAERSGPADEADRPVAVWIGNDVRSQGVSAVYTSQRDFLRRHGFEVYNVYVPFPDLAGHVEDPTALEKRFIAESLGWAEDPFDFGCYSWMLGWDSDDRRLEVLHAVASEGASYRRFREMNSYAAIPEALRRLTETRDIRLVCLNYVHLLPVVEKLNLAGRPGTRIVLETHDVQAYQHAIRANRAVDEADKDAELSKLAEADHIVAISRAEFDEIRECNPWSEVSFILPRIKINRKLRETWVPGLTGINVEFCLELWIQTPDLRQRFDLKSLDSIQEFVRSLVALVRLGFVTTPRPFDGADRFLTLPHPRFASAPDRVPVNNFWGTVWEARPDLRREFPGVRDPNHADRDRFIHWTQTHGCLELKAGPKSLAFTPLSEVGAGDPTSPAALVEAVLLARPTAMADAAYRTAFLGWLRRHQRANLLVVGSDHPSNVMSIRRFIEETFVPMLEPAGYSLVVAGRVCWELQAPGDASGLLLLGECGDLEPLYMVADVVAVPVFMGSGTPVKALDAFARGLCLSVTAYIDRSLALRDYGIPLPATPKEFGEDLLHLLASEAARAERRALVERFRAEWMSDEAFDRKWCEVAAIAAPTMPASEGNVVAAAASGNDAPPLRAKPPSSRRAKVAPAGVARAAMPAQGPAARLSTEAAAD